MNVPVTLDYDCIENANSRHIALARYYASGVPIETISKTLGYRLPYIEKVLAHPPIMQYVEDIKTMIHGGVMEQTIALSEIRDKTIKLLHERIDNPDITTGQLLQVAKMAFEHHPDRAFVKTTKQQIEHDHGYDNSAIKGIKERAKALGIQPKKYIEAKDVEVIDVEFDAKDTDE